MIILKNMERPISDDEFDVLWEKAVEEAARRKRQQRPSQKEPSERRKPRSDIFPASPLVNTSRPIPKQNNVSSPNPPRSISIGGDQIRPKIGDNGARRNTAVVRSLPLALEPIASSPTQERKPPQEVHGKALMGKTMRRHSSFGIDEIEASSPRERLSRRSSTLTVSDEMLHDSVKTQISFSNLPEMTELMKKPSKGTTATAASDFSSAKQQASKHWSDDADGGSTSLIGELKISSKSKKISVNDTQRKVADYILDKSSENGQSTPKMSLPVIHSISSFKENKDQLSGLVISRDAGCEVLVRKITPNSIFSETPLQQGHEILTINGRRVKCPLRATTIVKSIKGEVNLLVSEGERPPGTKYVKAKMEKHPRNGSAIDSVSMKSEDHSIKDLGLLLESTRHGLVRVAKVEEDSVFSNTPIRENEVVLAVNGESAQSVDIAMTALGKFYRSGGVAILLVYSMIDLRLGLLDRIIQSPWEVYWDANFQGATISKKVAANKDGVSFCIVFDDDWSCDLIPSESASLEEKEEINLAIDKLNGAISRAAKSWKDALQVCQQDQFTAAC